MDYCHPCGRHLNGALACAGCGTPVEELRHHSPSAPEPEHVHELDVVSEPADASGPRRSRRQSAPRRKPAGRRARKRRGRKVLLGTVGLVLAAGALSLAELAIEGSGDDGAATAVREQPIAASDTPEATAPEDAPEGPDQVKGPAVTKSGSPGPGKTRGGEGPEGEGGGSAGEDSEGDGPKPSASGPAGDGTPSASSSGDPEAPGEPGGSGGPPSDPGATEPPGQQDPPPPPEPTPTETCKRWLFWCV